MLAVNNLNYKYIHTWTANCVADITRFRVMTSSWPNLFCWSYWRNLGQEHKFLWCIWFEVLPAVNVKYIKWNFVGTWELVWGNCCLQLQDWWQSTSHHGVISKREKYPVHERNDLERSTAPVFSDPLHRYGYGISQYCDLAKSVYCFYYCFPVHFNSLNLTYQLMHFYIKQYISLNVSIKELKNAPTCFALFRSSSGSS
jgi:hypothetical protein